MIFGLLVATIDKKTMVMQIYLASSIYLYLRLHFPSNLSIIIQNGSMLTEVSKLAVNPVHIFKPHFRPSSYPNLAFRHGIIPKKWKEILTSRKRPPEPRSFLSLPLWGTFHPPAKLDRQSLGSSRGPVPLFAGKAAHTLSSL